MKYALPLVGLVAGIVLIANSAKATTKPTVPKGTRPPRPIKRTVAPETPSMVPTQADYIRAAVRGTLEYVWLDLPGAPGWQVTADAVKLDGHRFPVTARTAQHIADVLGAQLTTPLIEDMIEGGATAKIISPTIDYRIMHKPEASDEFNRDIDSQLIKLEAARNELVSAVGKSWVLTKHLESEPQAKDGGPAACNYGMFRPDGPYMSITGKYKLWQQPSYTHNIDHIDYSQVLRLCRSKSPGLPIPSNDGVTITRQPSVPLENATIALET